MSNQDYRNINPISSNVSIDNQLMLKKFDEHEYRIKSELQLRFVIVVSTLTAAIIMILASIYIVVSGYGDRIIALTLIVFGSTMLSSQYIMIFAKNGSSGNLEEKYLSNSSRSKYFDEINK